MLRLALALLVGFAASAGASAADRPNFLWIVAEDISPLFGCYGDPDGATPNIDALAADSHLFLNAYATAPICSPSRSCLATGMYATSLGTQNLRSEVDLPERIDPLAAVLKRNGYWTALRGKTDYNFEPTGLFDYWKQDTAPWKHCPKDKPFYAFMNLGSTHEGSGNLSDRANRALPRLPSGLKHDPRQVELPPYYPDTPEMRRIWARYHDLITLFDQEVGEVLRQLAADGHTDDTIVFLMADHGMGLPRYKRWLYLTGLHVPLIIHVPAQFEPLVGEPEPAIHRELVSYVDLPATVLELAGIPIPGNFQGQPIFDPNSDPPQRRYIFGARDRADDMYDLSRAVFDGRYLYVRHYLPHQIPMQEGIIMSPYKKESHKELYRVRDAGEDTQQSAKLWARRPHEELYDLSQDPEELDNRADAPALAAEKKRLAQRLRQWIVETRDSGFLTEPEMHRRANAQGVTPYDILQDPKEYPIEPILATAEQASDPDAELLGEGEDPIETYWAIEQRIIRGDDSAEAIAFLESQLDSPNPMVRTAAAEGLARAGKPELAIETLRELLTGADEPNLRLYVARSIATSLDDVRPLEAEARAVREQMLAPPGSERPWKDFTYSAFTTWALEWALIKSGLNSPEDFGL